MTKENLAFCTACGAPSTAKQPPAAPSQRMETASRGPEVPEVSRSYQCAWCGRSGQGTELSCPACGAGIDVRAIVGQSGWHEMPPIRNMAKLQFGDSYCQIEGMYVPVADMNLSESDGVYFAHHVLLWKDPRVNITTLSLRKGWKRLLAGLPLIMTQARGPGHIAFSKDAPGELIALPLQPGQTVEVREHIFVVATSEVGYDWVNSGIWFSTRNGDERETHYPLGMFLDRFSVSGKPGLVLLHGNGNVFARQLSANEEILVKPTSLLFKDLSVTMQLHFERPGGTWRTWRSWGERHLWLRLCGPGRVAVQSAWEHFHDPGHDLYDNSPATWQRW